MWEVLQPAIAARELRLLVGEVARARGWCDVFRPKLGFGSSSDTHEYDEKNAV